MTQPATVKMNTRGKLRLIRASMVTIYSCRSTCTAKENNTAEADQQHALCHTQWHLSRSTLTAYTARAREFGGSAVCAITGSDTSDLGMACSANAAYAWVCGKSFASKKHAVDQMCLFMQTKQKVLKTKFFFQT